jgi:hypothetical protein
VRDWRDYWRKWPPDRLNKPNAARVPIRGSELRILPGASVEAPEIRAFCLPFLVWLLGFALRHGGLRALHGAVRHNRRFLALAALAAAVLVIPPARAGSAASIKGA